MSTNFDLSPPVVTVDGLLAVPIDIQTISASLTFDGATSSGTGDATIEFIVGPAAGNPIFDLRQTTISAAWLDGVPIAVANLALHDFGGGPSAQLRILQSVLAAGSTHTLRVTYDLATPQAGGSPPMIAWAAGPRLTFRFGMTDLSAGRYLEAWIPANLIFDQFAMTLTLQIVDTAIAHTVITNGAVTPLGANHWSIDFPLRFTALSPLLELRATDTLLTSSDTTILPVSGTNVTIEAWKLASDAATNLVTQIGNIKTFLANNENSTGPYLHGNRFVAFFLSGGMEYEGGTTTGVSALRHETFHSWWARGVKPASQADAWFDEAWTKYNDAGAASSAPFNYADAPVELCWRNPWVRVTNSAAYTEGKEFFDGAASLIGVANLNSLMSDFYDEHKARPATTAQLEEFLVARSGNAGLVDGFHRFAYGYPDPSPVPDLWLRDAPGHAGDDLWGAEFWDSPDLWIRNDDDGGLTHEQPELGQDNWFHARVRNRSATATARHFLVTFNVKQFAGTQFQYPNDFLPCIAAAAGFELGPGQQTIVKARWPAALVPAEGTHACWLASVITRLDHPITGRQVWEHNNLAQKNLTIVDLEKGDWMILPFVLENLKLQRVTTRTIIDVIRPERFSRIETALLHKSDALFGVRGKRRVVRFELPLDRGDSDSDVDVDVECGADRLRDREPPGRILTSRRTFTRSTRHFAESFAAPFEAGRRASIPLALRGNDQRVLGLFIRVPGDAKSGDVIRMHLVQRDATGKRILGGIAVEVRVR